MELNRVFRGLQCQKVWKKNISSSSAALDLLKGPHGRFPIHGGTPSSSIYRWIFLIFHEIRNKPSIQVQLQFSKTTICIWCLSLSSDLEDLRIWAELEMWAALCSLHPGDTNMTAFKPLRIQNLLNSEMQNTLHVIDNHMIANREEKKHQNHQKPKTTAYEVLDSQVLPLSETILHQSQKMDPSQGKEVCFSWISSGVETSQMNTNDEGM